MFKSSDNVIRILVKYVKDIIKAQSILEKYCEEIGTSMKNLSFEYIPQIILQIAEDRDDFHSLNDVQFNNLLQELVILSNSKNKRISKKDVEMVVESKSGMVVT